MTIKIEDKNDCEPQFIGLPYELTIARNIKPGDKVISVKAIDADEGFNGVVRFVKILSNLIKLSGNDAETII